MGDRPAYRGHVPDPSIDTADPSPKRRIGAGRGERTGGTRREPFRMAERSRGDRSTTYELFILAVSILSIVNLTLYAVFPWK
jgi:hypothetical protein